MLKLIIEDDEGRKTVVPFVRDEITIGRQEGNTIRLTERNVSRRHCRLMRNNGHVLVEDLGSYNGIRINGDRIAGQVQVNEGDLIQIGDYDLAVQREGEQVAAAHPNNAATQELSPVRSGATPRIVDNQATIPALPSVDGPGATLSSDDEPEEANPDDVSPAPAQPVDEAAARRQSTAIIRMDQVEASRPRQVVEIDATDAPRLVVLNTSYAGKEFSCVRSELRVGRTDDNDIALDHPSLSRTHCKVVREETGEWRVIDLQSANGLMVNGESYAQAPLRHGDVLELGHLKLKFVGAGESYTYKPGAEGKSKAPIFAVLLLLVAASVGGGYYWLKVRQPPKIVDTDPVVTPPPPSTDGEPERAPEVSPEDVKKRIAEAKKLQEQNDWDGAIKMLQGAFCGEQLCDEAKRMLSGLKGEMALKKELDAADELIKAGNLSEAKNKLEGVRAESPVLLADRIEVVQKSLGAATEEALAKARQPKNNDPAPQPNPPQPVGPTPAQAKAAALEKEAETQLAQGVAFYKSGDFAGARAALEKCVAKQPQQYECHKQLGATFAKLGDGVLGAKHYELFVKYAPADHPSRDKVLQFLEQYKKQR